MGYGVDISVDSFEEDEIEWHVTDIGTSHLNLLNTLLHEIYNDEICELILGIMTEKENEAEMERQLTIYEDKQRESFVFNKHGVTA